MRKQTIYKPVFEDWLFHVLFPLLAYAMILTSSIIAQSNPHRSLYLVGASSLVLLFVGIHNAWDTTTYYIFILKQREKKREGDK